MLNARVAPAALETEARSDPELERHGETPGSTIHDTAVSGDGLEGTSSSTRSLSDNDVGTSVLKGPEGLHGLDSSTGGQEGEAFSVVEKQPPGSPFQVQPASWNLWQQPSKVPRSLPWSHPQQAAAVSRKASRPQECQGFLPETTVATTTSKTEVINARVDQASRVACAACSASAVNPHPQHVDATGDNQAQRVQPPDGCAIDKINHSGGPCLVGVVDATGRDGNNAHGLLPQCKSSDASASTAGERAYTPRKQAGIPPRCRSMEKVIPGGMIPRLVGVRRQGQHSSPSKRSSGGVGRTREPENLSARAVSAAAAAAAVLNDDIRRKSESDVQAMYHNRLALTTEQGHAAAVVTEATVGGIEGVGSGSRRVSGGDRRATPLRNMALFSSREAWALGKGPKIIDYFKGSRSAAGAERPNSNVTIPQGMPNAHAPLRARSPASTPGTRRMDSASVSTSRRWRPRSISRRRPDPETQSEKRQRGEGEKQSAAIPSGGPETAAAAGIVSSAIRATDPGDGNFHTLASKDASKDHDVPVIGCNDDDNNNDDKAASSEGAAVVVVDRSEGEEGEVTGGGKKGGASAVVAPEELEAENAFEEKEKKEDEVEEEEEEEEPEAVVSETCSFTGILDCGRSLRVEGKVVGEVLSTGSVIVGPTGSITGDLRSIKFLLVDGQVKGNVFCDRVVITNAGEVFGNVTSETITISPQATMRGKLDVVESISEARAEAQAQTSAARPLAVEAESTMTQDRTTAGPSVASEGEGMAAYSRTTTTGGEALESAPAVAMTQGESAKQEATAVKGKAGSNEIKVAAAHAE